MNVKNILLVIVVFTLVTTVAVSSVLGCYAVVVGKEASKDGSVIFGHNEQNGGNRIINFAVIPRMKHRSGEIVRLLRGGTLLEVPETYSFIWSENPGLEFSDTYINEWGVAVASNGCPTREDSYTQLVARGEIVDGGIGYMLRRLIVQRAKTAREGVQIAGELLNRFGYSDSGRTLTIADSNEAWLLSIVRGKHWVAQRVPDDEVALLPNVHIISEIDLNDSDNFMGTPDIVDYAIRRGWFNPALGSPFSFRAAYNQSRRNGWDMRQWQGQYLVTGRTIEPVTGQLPFSAKNNARLRLSAKNNARLRLSARNNARLRLSVKPEKKLTVKDVINILRYHGQRGTICGPQTQEAAVFQLRSWLPPQIGCIYWRTSAEPCSGVLIPWYLGITETPEIYYKPVDLSEHLTLSFHFNPPARTFDYDPFFAWWTFKTLQDLVNEDYQISINRVRGIWDDFEARVFANQSVVEKEALSLFSKDKDLARLYLTNYSKDLALQAVDMANEMEDIGLSGERNQSAIIATGEIQFTTWGRIKNALLQNFPNPFNPETWIPYQLEQDAKVIIRIYNAKGQLIRTLHLGSQPTGSYLTKDRAAHWNGRDNIGQKAASGLYFYTIKAGDFNATRKMILVK